MEMDGPRISFAVPKIQWNSNPQLPLRHTCTFYSISNLDQSIFVSMIFVYTNSADLGSDCFPGTVWSGSALFVLTGCLTFSIDPVPFSEVEKFKTNPKFLNTSRVSIWPSHSYPNIIWLCVLLSILESHQWICISIRPSPHPCPFLSPAPSPPHSWHGFI